MEDLKNLGPIKIKSTVDIVIDRLTQAIIDRTLKPGDKLPTEPDLAASFGVGRNTVREAIRTLTAYGILESRRPNGTFVCDTFKPQGINPLLYGMILQKEDSYEELIGLRKVFEIGTLLLLSDKEITREQKEQLQERARAIEQAILAENPDVQAILDADIEFHNYLAALTGNQLIVLENDMINRLTYASRIKTIEKVLQEDDQKYLIDTHYDLVEKLESGEAGRLYEAIQNSYFYWKDIYKEPPQTV